MSFLKLWVQISRPLAALPKHRPNGFLTGFPDALFLLLLAYLGLFSSPRIFQLLTMIRLNHASTTTKIGTPELHQLCGINQKVLASDIPWTGSRDTVAYVCSNLRTTFQEQIPNTCYLAVVPSGKDRNSHCNKHAQEPNILSRGI